MRKGHEMTEHQAEANKAVVRRLYDVFRAGDAAALGEILTEEFHQPQSADNEWADGFPGFVLPGRSHRRRDPPDDLRGQPGGRPRTLHNAPEQCRMDFFKIENGKIVEHWDVLQDIPDATASGQDMFSELSN
jgi:predicted SnoaL-like aldol condensation-catalyzing enzyme